MLYASIRQRKGLKMNRRTAREITLCLLFNFSFNTEEKPDELLELYLTYFPDAENGIIPEEIRVDNYISKTYFGVTQKLSEIDALIENASKKWKPERISRVSRSILRLAVYEILYIDDIPEKVSINEAVELAKRFDDENGYTFINGILGNVVSGLSEKA